MRKPMRVTLLRSGNRMVISPTTDRIYNLLAPNLKFVEKKFAQGAELGRRKKADLPIFDEIEWSCFGMDHKERIATSYGFRTRVRRLLKKAGYKVKTKWASDKERVRREDHAKKVYNPRWDRIDELVQDGFTFRPRQREALEVISNFESGRINCPTGWGKGTMIMLIATLYPKAKIDVVVKGVEVLKQRLYPELASNLPSVGIVGGGMKIKGQRVMCYSADSLHHARPDADFVLVDEGHRACADDFSRKMGIYDCARVWMFSASWDMRLDNKDMRAEAMAGPIRFSVTYQEAMEQGMVVPIKIIWSDVIMDENPCADLDGVEKKRYGIWCNEYRNKIIARDVRTYDDDTQVLITVETLEHALNLKRELPEFTVVYSGMGLKDSDIRRLSKKYPDEFTEMTDERKRKLTKRFERGKLKKVIATTVWNVGVDFRHLEVLARADAGGSPINDTQIPGRTSRINDSLEKQGKKVKKKFSIIRDYLDQFDPGFNAKSRSRERSYAKNEWKQVRPDIKSRSKLRRMMNLGTKV